MTRIHFYQYRGGVPERHSSATLGICTGKGGGGKKERRKRKEERRKKKEERRKKNCVSNREPAFSKRQNEVLGCDAEGKMTGLNCVSNRGSDFSACRPWPVRDAAGKNTDRKEERI